MYCIKKNNIRYPNMVNFIVIVANTRWIFQTAIAVWNILTQPKTYMQSATRKYREVIARWRHELINYVIERSSCRARMDLRNAIVFRYIGSARFKRVVNKNERIRSWDEFLVYVYINLDWWRDAGVQKKDNKFTHFYPFYITIYW